MHGGGKFHCSERRCEVHFPFLFLSSTILLLLSLFVRCTTLRPNDFTLVSGGFCVSARDSTYVRIYIVQLEHVDAIGTSEVISHSLPFVLCQSGLFCLVFTPVVSFSYKCSIRKMCFVLTCMCRWARERECLRLWRIVFWFFNIYIIRCFSIVDTQFTCTFTFEKFRSTHNKIRFVVVQAIGYFQNIRHNTVIERFDKMWFTTVDMVFG